MKYLKICKYSVCSVCLLLLLWILLIQTFDTPPLITLEGSNYCIIKNATPRLYYRESYGYHAVIDDYGLTEVFYNENIVCAHYKSQSKEDYNDYYYVIKPFAESYEGTRYTSHNISGPFEYDSLVSYLNNTNVNINDLQLCTIPEKFANNRNW